MATRKKRVVQRGNGDGHAKGKPLSLIPQNHSMTIYFVGALPCFRNSTAITPQLLSKGTPPRQEHWYLGLEEKVEWMECVLYKVMANQPTDEWKNERSNERDKHGRSPSVLTVQPVIVLLVLLLRLFWFNVDLISNELTVKKYTKASGYHKFMVSRPDKSRADPVRQRPRRKWRKDHGTFEVFKSPECDLL